MDALIFRPSYFTRLVERFVFDPRRSTIRAIIYCITFLHGIIGFRFQISTFSNFWLLFALIVLKKCKRGRGRLQLKMLFQENGKSVKFHIKDVSEEEFHELTELVEV